MKELHFRLPEWTNKIFYPGSILEKLLDHLLGFSTINLELSRLRFGFLLREILNRLSDKVESKLIPDHKLSIYSGHDQTISNLLDLLGLYNVRINAVVYISI